MTSRRGLGGPAALLLLLAAAPTACRSPQPDPRYRPAQSILEVIAVLRRHVPDDTYRFDPSVDFTGRNVYRASLLRLENLERIHADALRAGHMNDVIAFAKGRALERIRAFELAAASYRAAARRDGALRQDAQESAAICETLAEAARVGFDADHPPEAGAEAPFPGSAEEALAAYEKRVALLEGLNETLEDTHYVYVVREELERADLARARYFAAVRQITREGDVRALAELQRVAVRHRESRRANRHLLTLADLYADLAAEYVESHPPPGLLFDPPTFQEYADSAARLYEVVANQDGTPEKLEASQRLEAFLAFTLKVDRDRFAP